MNVVLLSPHFLPHHFRFCHNLKTAGATVPGIGDEPGDHLAKHLKDPLSGLHRLDRPEFQITADDLPAVYFNSPLAHLPGLTDPTCLERYWNSRIVVCSGRGAWEEEMDEGAKKAGVPPATRHKLPPGSPIREGCLRR